MSARDATIIEPLAVVLHSMQFVALRPAETAAVFGAGPIGLGHRAGRRAPRTGAPGRRPRGSGPLRHRPPHEILRDTGCRGVDVAIDCAATGGSTNHCLRATRNAGRVVVTGIPVEVQVPLEFSPMRRKELVVYTVRRSNHETEAAREMLAGNLPRFAAIITHTRPLDRIAEAFHQVEHRADGVGKLVIAG
jgi:threonine dehydrogenase-like Zn-dependent dehydrogenase